AVLAPLGAAARAAVGAAVLAAVLATGGAVVAAVGAAARAAVVAVVGAAVHAAVGATVLAAVLAVVGAAGLAAVLATGGADRHPFVGIVGIAGGVVVAVAAVGDIPLESPGHRAAAGRGEAGRRGVGAIAVDRDRLGVHRAAARTDQREGDGAGRIIAVGERGRIGQGHGGRPQRDRARVGSGGEPRGCPTDPGLLGGPAPVAGRRGVWRAP